MFKSVFFFVWFVLPSAVILYGGLVGGVVVWRLMVGWSMFFRLPAALLAGGLVWGLVGAVLMIVKARPLGESTMAAPRKNQQDT